MTEREMTVDAGGLREQRVRVDYPSNSKRNHKPLASADEPTERERQEKIVTGNVVQRKSSVGRKLAQTFIQEDMPSVTEYVIMEVLVPAAKNMIADVFTTGLQRMLFGGAARTSSVTGARPGYTSYNSITKPAARTVSSQAKASHNFSEVILESRAEAEDVLDRMRDVINEYQVVTVADFYDLIGHTGEFTDNKWGWDDLRSASIRPTRGGYLLSLPRTIALS
jgi:hypothetical protein